MGARRRAGIRTYLPIGNGQEVHIPNISSPHFFQYRVSGVRVRTLQGIRDGIAERARIEYWSYYSGKCDNKYILNYDTGNWQELKTYAAWEGDLHTYLKLGDVVDEEMADHFINVMPPATMNGRLVQMGEPYSHVDGRATYPTLERTSAGWTWRGHCWRGDTVNK